MFSRIVGMLTGKANLPVEVVVKSRELLKDVLNESFLCLSIIEKGKPIFGSNEHIKLYRSRRQLSELMKENGADEIYKHWSYAEKNSSEDFQKNIKNIDSVLNGELNILVNLPDGEEKKKEIYSRYEISLDENNIDEESIDDVAKHLKIMGYDLNDYGIGAAYALLSSNYSSVEASSAIALTTMALDIKETQNIMSLIKISHHGMLLVEALTDYKSKKLMHPSQYLNDVKAIKSIMSVNEQQLANVDDILDDPILGKERVAISRINYNVTL